MRLKHPDLLLATTLALANIAWAFLPYHLPAIGTTLALPLIFIVPGYTITAALFHRRSLDTSYRLLLSLGISISIVIIGGLLLNALPAGLHPSSWSLFLACLTLVFAALVAYLRRKTEPLASPTYASRLTPLPGIASTPDNAASAPTPQVEPTPRTVPISRVASTRLQAWLVCALALLVVAFSLVFSASSVAQQPHAGFTQFWLLPSNQPGADCAVQLGIQSDEAITETYRVAMTANGAAINTWPSIQLTPHQQWNQSVTIRPIQPGPLSIEARLSLVKTPDVVYREVHITIYGTKSCEVSHLILRNPSIVGAELVPALGPPVPEKLEK